MRITITSEDRSHAKFLQDQQRTQRRQNREDGVTNALDTMEYNVKVANSGIHGLGAFAVNPMTKNTCVIEYKGEIINVQISNTREEEYQARGIGEIYFYHISETDCVIDATNPAHGNAAKYCNHACYPNLKTKVIYVNGIPRLYYVALRDIYEGEELTIDYQILKEDVTSNIPCNCGHKRCMGFIDWC